MMKCLVKQTAKGYVEYFYVFLRILKFIPYCIFDLKMSKFMFRIFSCAISMIVLEVYMLLWADPSPNTSPLIIMIGIVTCFIGVPLFMVPVYNAVFDCMVTKSLKEE